MTIVSINRITSSASIDENFENYLIDATSGNITLTLPDIYTEGIDFTFKREDSTGNTVTLQPYSVSNTIEGTTSLLLAVSECVRLVSYDTNWNVFS